MDVITQVGDEVLRKIAKEVPQTMFGTKELKNILDKMISILDTQDDGIALAAPQISISYRIFVVRYDRLLTPLDTNDEKLKPSVGIFINPKIIRTSHKSEEMEEGCLSVRDIYGKVYRLNRATVRAYTVDGVVFQRDGGGILAQAFQHEVDHLDGILFIDYTNDLYRISRDDDATHNE